MQRLRALPRRRQMRCVSPAWLVRCTRQGLLHCILLCSAPHRTESHLRKSRLAKRSCAAVWCHAVRCDVEVLQRLTPCRGGAYSLSRLTGASSSGQVDGLSSEAVSNPG